MRRSRTVADDDGYESSSSENMTPAERVAQLGRLPPLDPHSYARLPTGTPEQRNDFMWPFVVQVGDRIASGEWQSGEIFLGPFVLLFEKHAGVAGWEVCLTNFSPSMLRNVYATPVMYLRYVLGVGSMLSRIMTEGAIAIRTSSDFMAYVSWLQSEGYNASNMCFENVDSLSDLIRILHMVAIALPEGAIVAAHVNAPDGSRVELTYDFYLRMFTRSSVGTGAAGAGTGASAGAGAGAGTGAGARGGKARRRRRR